MFGPALNKIINSAVLVCLLTLPLYRCAEKEQAVAIPADIIPKDTFVKILTDFALSESAANMNIMGVPVQKIDSVYAFDPLSENHVRQGQYDSTLEFYTQHPDLYKKVYEEVMIRLTEIQSEKGKPADSARGKKP
jgi:hypothetical protein